MKKAEERGLVRGGEWKEVGWEGERREWREEGEEEEEEEGEVRERNRWGVEGRLRWSREVLEGRA